MAAVIQLQKQFIEYTTSLYNEGYIDNQFMRILKLQIEDESDPEFLGGMVSNYSKYSEGLLKNLGTALQQKTVDYKQVAVDVHQFKGSSSSIGAQRVNSACLLFLNYCKEKNLDGCLWCLHQANQECILFRNKLEALLRLKQRIFQAGGKIPMMEGLGSD